MAAEVWPSIEQEYLACLHGGGYIGGKPVTAFEQEWAAYCGAGFAIGVANGTDALQLTLTALGVGPGDEVIVPANTFIATAAAVVPGRRHPPLRRRQRRHPAHDAGHAASCAHARTRAVIVVHLFGQVAEMAGIGSVAREAGHCVDRGCRPGTRCGMVRPAGRDRSATPRASASIRERTWAPSATLARWSRPGQS